MTGHVSRRVIPWLLASTTLASCAIDERTLEEGVPSAGSSGSSGDSGADTGPDAGDGGSSTGGTGTGGTAGTSDAGGDGGSAAESPSTEGCTDLDRNGVTDCVETLVENPTFDRDAEGWRLDTGVSAIWDPFDADGRTGSGSLSVENDVFVNGDDSFSMAGVVQCVRVEPSKQYLFYGQAHIQAERVTGYAGLSGWFYETPDCSGIVTLPVLSPQVGTINLWSTMNFVLTAPVTAKSLLVRLVAAKPFSLERFTVRFDNVLLKAAP